MANALRVGDRILDRLGATTTSAGRATLSASPAGPTRSESPTEVTV
jgi:hypothetical protein